MKRIAWLSLLLTTASLWVVGCGGGDNGVGPNPNPNTTGPYGLKFTILWEDGTPADGVKMKVASDSGTQSVTVTNGTATIAPLERDVEYEFSVRDKNGELIELDFGGEEVGTSFKLSLAEGEHVDKLNIPVFRLLPKSLPPTTGTLDITTNPAGATVFVDDEERGVTPLTLQLDPGVYKGKLVLEGYRDEYFFVELLTGQTIKRDLTLTFIPIPGTLIITSTPTGATVWVSGWEQGKTPVEVTNLLPGTYGVRVLLEGYRDEDFSVEVIGGQTTQRDLILVKSQPIDRFPTEPTVWLVGGIFITGERFLFWRVGHIIYYSASGTATPAFEVGTITDDGVVEIHVWRRILKGQFYPDDMEIRGEATAPENPDYHVTFTFYYDKEYNR